MSGGKATRQRRTTRLSVTFKGDRAVGWRFPLPSAFRAALDIRRTERVVKKETPDGTVKRKELVWTEGIPPLYSFQLGDTISTIDFPQDGEQHHLLVQVVQGVPDEWDGYSRKVRPGTIIAQVYRPAGPQGGWDRAEVLSLSQAAFVVFLKTGNPPLP